MLLFIDINHSFCFLIFFILKSIFSKVTDFITKSNEVNQVETHWMSESGVIDIFFMFGPSPLDIFRQYGLLTGTTNLPPVIKSDFFFPSLNFKFFNRSLFKLFSIAYHQCRWNYNDDQDVRK